MCCALCRMRTNFYIRRCLHGLLCVWYSERLAVYAYIEGISPKFCVVYKVPRFLCPSSQMMIVRVWLAYNIMESEAVRNSRYTRLTSSFVLGLHTHYCILYGHVGASASPNATDYVVFHARATRAAAGQSVVQH